MKVLSVVGARPQFVKLAPVHRAFMGRGWDHLVVHTGQHYDANMSEAFFADFSLPAADINLGIGSGTQAVQTARMLEALEPVYLDVRPDWVLVYGDTNSTLAASLAAVKIDQRVAHLESGLRSCNRTMPEEHNRVLTDHAADLLLAPTQVAMGHLADEGLADRAVLVGDVMTDICLATAAHVGAIPPPELWLPSGDFLLATLHRPYNTDDPIRLGAIVGELRGSPIPVLLPAHPRLAAKAARFGIELAGGALHIVDPLPYPSLVAALLAARGVITDSGGLQKEAYLLGVPCTTLRSETEWVETLDGGWNVLVFDDLHTIVPVALRDVPTGERPSNYGNGDAASRVSYALVSA